MASSEERASGVRAVLRWVAPVLSIGVLVALIARASSCSERADPPAALTRDPDTHVRPAQPAQASAQQDAPAQQGAPAHAEERLAVDAGARQRAPAIELLRTPSNRAFLGGTKSSALEALHVADPDAVQDAPPDLHETAR